MVVSDHVLWLPDFNLDLLWKSADSAKRDGEAPGCLHAWSLPRGRGHQYPVAVRTRISHDAENRFPRGLRGLFRFSGRPSATPGTGRVLGRGLTSAVSARTVPGILLPRGCSKTLEGSSFVTVRLFLSQRV